MKPKPASTGALTSGSQRPKATKRRRTNQGLLILLPLAVVTGLFSNTIGLDWLVDPATVHAVVALAIAVVTPWKAPIVQRGLGRNRRGRGTSILLLAFVATALLSGLLHTTALTSTLGPLTVMQVHIGSALMALVLVVFHYRSHPVPVRRTDVDRRAFLAASGVAASATALWIGWEGLLKVTGSRGAERRFTGSHERGSFDPSAMPVTSWLDDRVPTIEPAPWSVQIGDRRISLAELANLPNEDVTATLDCTSGWYSRQDWTGVRLDRLITPGSVSITVRSHTGYSRRFPTRDLDALWLVTHVAGRPLSPGHGFPARIVAPGRRGFWWIKWVEAIEPSDTPAWLQLPFPVT